METVSNLFSPYGDSISVYGYPCSYLLACSEGFCSINHILVRFCWNLSGSSLCKFFLCSFARTRSITFINELFLVITRRSYVCIEKWHQRTTSLCIGLRVECLPSLYCWKRKPDGVNLLYMFSLELEIHYGTY